MDTPNTISLTNSTSATRKLGAMLLVAGTTIGAGMLALPLLTASAGFYSTAFLFIFYWAISLLSAFLMLEATLMFCHPVNVISMSRATLGKAGEMISWVTYLLLLYSLTAAYLSGGGSIFAEMIFHTTGILISPWAESLPFLAIFGSLVFMGTRPVDFTNRILMLGLTISYILLLAFSFDRVNVGLLHQGNFYSLAATIPVVATSFGFQIIVPTLATYLKRDIFALRQTIAIGCSIPLVIYLLWEFVVLGIIPHEDLKMALDHDNGAINALNNILQNPWLGACSKCFAFIAVVTSFLGVSLSLFHFLLDGLKIEQNRKGKISIISLTFGPPLFFVLFYPRGFIMALEYAGVFVVILLGILPVLLVWRGRKLFKEASSYVVPGGNTTLCFVILVYTVILGFIINDLI